MGALRYAFDEAFRSLWRGRASGAISTATIALALFVLGAFLVLTRNLEQLAAEWRSAAELSVYVRDDVSPAERVAIEDALTRGDVIAAHEFVSKSDAMERFKRTFTDLASTIDSLGDNPLPASYDVRLRPAASSDDVDALGTRLRQLAGVADVRFDREWLVRLLSAVAIVRGIGMGLGLVLTVAAGLTVANVVRLALYARRDELEIMELVGAPGVYIRGPFVVEGVLQGGIGASVALLALAMTFFALHGRYLAPLSTAMSLSAVRFLAPASCVAIVAGGMVVGCIGGVVAAAGRASRVA